MYYFVSLLVILMFFTGIAKAETGFPGEGDVYNTWKTDLNKDGKDEKIVLKAYGVDPENYTWFGQLIVYNSSGQKIWAGPKSQDMFSPDPLVFGCWDYGYSLPEVAGDIDGDGTVEMVAPLPISDVRYTPFKLFKWTGKEFSCIYENKTLCEYPAGSGKYPWGNREGYEGRWISEFMSFNKDGTCNVKIVDFSAESSGGVGEAVVAPHKGGFHISSWIKSPQ